MPSPQVPHTIVFGGTSVVGNSIATLFLERGHRVSVVGRRAKPPQTSFDYYRFDLTRVGGISGLMARIVRHSGFWSNLVFVQRYRGAEEWKGEWITGVDATREAIEAAAALASDLRPRSVVIFNSIASSLIAGNQVGYHVAKAAQNQLMRYYAVSLGPRAIRVNCVSPATILKKPLELEPPSVRSQVKKLNQRIPLGRMGQPQDMAAAAFLLCHSDASYITGHDLVVDGGLSLLAQENLIRTSGDVKPTQKKKSLSS